MIRKVAGVTDKTFTYEGPANGIEAEEMKKLLPKLQQSQKVAKLVKDGDVHMPVIVREMRWDIPLVDDPNHKIKNFPKAFTTHNKAAGGKLTGLMERIHAWLRACISYPGTTSRKLNVS
jgi:hypothetical protein